MIKRLVNVMVLIFVCLGFQLVTPAFSGEGRKRPNPPVLRCHRTNIPPVIDGRLDDKCWRKSAEIERFLVYIDGNKPKEQTEAYLLYDEDNLYIGFKCYKSRMDKLAKFSTVRKKVDPPVWLDDSIEIFLDTNHDKKTYYQFCLNAGGVKMEGRMRQKKWDCDWEANTFLEITFGLLRSGYHFLLLI